MGSLSNLYISQSYISLLHFGSDSSASNDLTPIQDGLGYSTGISMNNKGDLAVGGQLIIGGGLTLSGSTKINTIYTSSTPQYVNSGNQFTDNIIRITGSYASGSQQSPTLNEVQVGWPVYGDGLVSGAVVTNTTFIPATGWEFTINQNTAVWFGKYYFTNPTPQYYNFSVSGSEDITGSLWVRDNITTNTLSASSAISASDLWVKNTIHAYKLDVTIESSSIIFTSGSNIIGDEANSDTQTLVGRVIVTGSLEVTGSTTINGNITSTGSLKVTNDISSSTVNGIGNVTLYSQSVASRLTTDSASFYNFSSSQYKADSSSFNSRITAQENFSSSLVATFATNASLNNSSSILQSNINTKLDTASFNSFSSSVSTTISRAATTGSNTFIGNQSLTGSLIVSSSADIDLNVIGNSYFNGKVNGTVTALNVVSGAASFDTSLGNFFSIQLVSGSNTTISAANVSTGQTISMLVQQSAVGYGSVTFTSNVKFPQAFPYLATPISGAIDIITFVSYGSTLYGVAVNTMI